MCGFGFVDNFIMLTAGDAIDNSFGTVKAVLFHPQKMMLVSAYESGSNVFPSNLWHPHLCPHLFTMSRVAHFHQVLPSGFQLLRRQALEIWCQMSLVSGLVVPLRYANRLLQYEFFTMPITADASPRGTFQRCSIAVLQHAGYDDVIM